MTVRLTLLEAGRSRQLEALARAGGSWRWISFPATVAVVEHSRHGVLLFDTGYSERFFTATARLPQQLYRRLVPARLAPGEAAVDQLAALGIEAATVGTVLLSHLHGDHLSGLRDFPRAAILLSAATDLRGAAPGRTATGRTAWRTTASGFLPELLPADLAGRRSDIEALPEVATGLPGFADGRDVFGDGSAVAVPLPGHAPGHLGLWLPATQGPPVFLVGDACWLAAAFTRGALPPAPVRALAGQAGPAYRRTVAGLAALALARPDVAIVPSHCQDSVAKLRRELSA